MDICFITFRSITPAQRGEGILKTQHVNCALKRTPVWLQEKGCGYSLRVGSKDMLRAVSVLRSQQIPFQKVYHQSSDGKAEEVML